MKQKDHCFKTLLVCIAVAALCCTRTWAASPADVLQAKLGSAKLHWVEFRDTHIKDVVDYLDQQSKTHFQDSPVVFSLQVSNGSRESDNEHDGPTRISLKIEMVTFQQLIAEIEERSNVTTIFSTNRVMFMSENPHDAVPIHEPNMPTRVYSSESAPIPLEAKGIARVAFNAMHTAQTNGVPFSDVIDGKYPIQLNLRFRQTARKYMSSPVGDKGPVEKTVAAIIVDDSAPPTILVDRLVAGGSVESAITAESWIFDPHLGSASDGMLKGHIWAYHSDFWPNVLSPGMYRITATLNAKITHSDTSVSDVRFSESAQLKIMPGPGVQEDEKCFMAWIWHAYHLATHADKEALTKRAIQEFEELISLEREFDLGVDHEGIVGYVAYRLDLYDIAHSILGNYILRYRNEHELITGGDSHQHDAYYRATRAFNELCVQRGVENPYR